MAGTGAVERAVAEAPPSRRPGWGAILLAALLAAALVFPWVFRLPYHRDLLIRIFLNATLAQAWNILAGYCGQIALGHAGR